MQKPFLETCQVSAANNKFSTVQKIREHLSKPENTNDRGDVDKLRFYVSKLNIVNLKYFVAKLLSLKGIDPTLINALKSRVDICKEIFDKIISKPSFDAESLYKALMLTVVPTTGAAPAPPVITAGSRPKKPAVKFAESDSESDDESDTNDTVEMTDRTGSRQKRRFAEEEPTTRLPAQPKQDHSENYKLLELFLYSVFTQAHPEYNDYQGDILKACSQITQAKSTKNKQEYDQGVQTLKKMFAAFDVNPNRDVFLDLMRFIMGIWATQRKQRDTSTYATKNYCGVISQQGQDSSDEAEDSSTTEDDSDPE